MGKCCLWIWMNLLTRHKPFKLTKVNQSGSFHHSFTSSPLLALLHTFREHLLGSIICWEIPHFITQPCVSASFVLAKAWEVAEKLLCFLLTEFSTTAAQAQPSSWAKGRGAWKGCLLDGTSLNDGASTGEEREKCSIGVKKEIKTQF